MSKITRKKTSKSTTRAMPPAQPAKAARKRADDAAAKTATTSPARKAPKAKPARARKPGPAPRPAAVGADDRIAAPDFTLPGHDGAPVSLSDFTGRKLVLFFYPRADTPGCTREAIAFTEHAEEFAAAGTALLGVSADPPKAQTAFRNKHGLTMKLASDELHTMLQAYGAWGQKSMYGKTFEGVLRTTYLIAADGRVAHVWRNVKVDGHVDEVLAAAQNL